VGEEMQLRLPVNSSKYYNTHPVISLINGAEMLEEEQMFAEVREGMLINYA